MEIYPNQPFSQKIQMFLATWLEFGHTSASDGISQAVNEAIGHWLDAQLISGFLSKKKKLRK